VPVKNAPAQHTRVENRLKDNLYNGCSTCSTGAVTTICNQEVVKLLLFSCNFSNCSGCSRCSRGYPLPF